MVLFWLQGSKLFRYFLRFYAHFWFTEGVLIKEPFHTKKDFSYTRTPFFLTQRKSILCFKCQMVKNSVPVKGLYIWKIHSRSPHHSGSEETWGDSLHAQRQMNQNKSCRVGYFLQRLFFRWSGAFSKASECLGLPSPIQGITLRLAHREE